MDLSWWIIKLSLVNSPIRSSIVHSLLLSFQLFTICLHHSLVLFVLLASPGFNWVLPLRTHCVVEIRTIRHSVGWVTTSNKWFCVRKIWFSFLRILGLRIHLHPEISFSNFHVLELEVNRWFGSRHFYKTTTFGVTPHRWAWPLSTSFSMTMTKLQWHIIASNCSHKRWVRLLVVTDHLIVQLIDATLLWNVTRSRFLEVLYYLSIALTSISLTTSLNSDFAAVINLFFDVIKASSWSYTVMS